MQEKIFKPRNCYFEYLFLSANSSLRKNLTPALYQFFRSSFGSVEYAFLNDNFIGALVEVITSKGKLADAYWLHSFGQILTTCGLFGITDLHIENIIHSSSKLQIIDLECLFWDSQIASDSMLLHHSSDRIKHTQRQKFQEIVLRTSLENALLILLQSILNSFLLLETNLSELRNTFLSLNKELRRFPIRIILQDTKIYKQALANQSITNFITEEVKQMETGSVPYFFGYIGQSDIYFLDINNAMKKVSSKTKEIEAKRMRAFKDPQYLLSDKRFFALQKQLLLSTAKILLDQEASLKVSSDLLEITKDNSTLELRTKNFRIGCRL